MRKILVVVVVAYTVIFGPGILNAQNYLNNQPPLAKKPYIELPLGSIKPMGWLKEQLLIQKNNMTGKLDSMYAKVVGPRNGWLGGDGDQWERGPYWIDGLLPLAYILDDQKLKDKVKPWIEWTLNSQKPNGYFGPDKDYPYEAGIQRDNARDWWPKMVMLKVLMQYYDATGDKRVIILLTNYFKYQLLELPKNPLGKWTFWAEQRGGDNLMVVYWLYNITHDRFLLDLGDLLHAQTHNWTDEFLYSDLLHSNGNYHGVNLVQGIKEPLIYYQHRSEPRFIKATDQALYDLNKYHGFPTGMCSGDEWTHGTDPTQGSEACANVEFMFSLETMLQITGEIKFAEQLEKIAFNAVPTQTTDNFNFRQYFQQINQIEISRKDRHFDKNFDGTEQVYGFLSAYPCCICNMHQGWPKFTQNLWYATNDNGLAALIYAPSEVTAKVADGKSVKIKEETTYPFSENIKFTVSITDQKVTSVSFPLHLRVPSWTKNATIKVNGKAWNNVNGNQIIKIFREWQNGDFVEFEFPMHVEGAHWHENSIAVERGPLLYALKIGEKWNWIENHDSYGPYWEVYPTTQWNYGLVNVFYKLKDTEWEKWNTGFVSIDPDEYQKDFQVIKKDYDDKYPWTIEKAPIELKVKARKIPTWKEVNGDASYMIPTVKWWELRDPKTEVEEVTLIPYGCTTLRITEFPIVRK